MVLAFLFLNLSINTAAHTLPVSFLRLVPDADYLHLELTFNPFELTFFSELDANKDRRLDSSEWEAPPGNAIRRIVDCLKVSVNGKPVTAEVAGIIPDFDSHHATLRAHYAVDARRGEVRVVSSLAALTSGSHFTQVTFSREGSAQSARLDAHAATVTFGKANETSAFPGGRTNRSADGLGRAPRDVDLGSAGLEAGVQMKKAFLPARDGALRARFFAAVLLALGALLGLAWVVRRGAPWPARDTSSESCARKQCLRGLVPLTPCFSGVWKDVRTLITVSTVFTRRGKPLKRLCDASQRETTPLKQGVNETLPCGPSKIQVPVQTHPPVIESRRTS